MAAFVFALAGCGVTTQEHPRRIDRDDVPFGLLGKTANVEPEEVTTTSTSTTTAPPPSGSQ